MTLTETFDTHIKAISTAEEWAEYKAMVNDMNAEKIARDHLFDEMEEVDQFEKHEWTPPEWLLKAMESYKSETLQELKAKIKKVEAGDNPQYQEAEYIRIEYVITIIDEAINE